MLSPVEDFKSVNFCGVIHLFPIQLPVEIPEVFEKGKLRVAFLPFLWHILKVKGLKVDI